MGSTVSLNDNIFFKPRSVGPTTDNSYESKVGTIAYGGHELGEGSFGKSDRVYPTHRIYGMEVPWPKSGNAWYQKDIGPDIHSQYRYAEDKGLMSNPGPTVYIPHHTYSTGGGEVPPPKQPWWVKVLLALGWTIEEKKIKDPVLPL